MKLLIDTHIHTIMSGHAYNSFQEIVDYSAKKKIKLICITDHGPSMKGAPYKGYFRMSKSIPLLIGRQIVLFGCECNVQNNSGILDLENEILGDLDIVLIGLHDHTPFDSSKGIEFNTEALINAMRNSYVDIVAHPYRKEFPVDIERVVESAKENNCVLELNLRVFSEYNNDIITQYTKMLHKCNELGVSVVVASDAHIIYDLDKKIRNKIILSLLSKYKNVLIKSPTELITFLNSKRQRYKLQLYNII